MALGWSRALGWTSAFGASLALTACGGSSPAASTAPMTVKLVQNPWDASRLDVAIADILLTEQLKMTVTVTELGEYTQWPYLAAGDEDACLEVWPSGHPSDMTNYVDTAKVEDLGELGPVGKISWYVPNYLLTGNPAVSSYEYFADVANTVPFETAPTERDQKGTLLSGDSSWTSYDAQIIKNLGLNLEEVFAGSEDQELQELDEMYQSRSPILLYLWTPHAALAKYELTPVQLPPYSDACYATIPTNGVNCDYPTDHLYKVAWPGLKTKNPRAYALLKNFTLTSEDQITLLNLVDNAGNSIVQAAQWWVSQPANKLIWQKWIPPQ
jgi:glycine betaine/proline transport system substrate-binding protein